MDELTIRTYDRTAEERGASYEQAEVTDHHALMLCQIPRGARVLEIGCGSGRDAAFLHDRGYKVVAADASQGMVEAALKTHPELAGQVRHAAFPLAADHDLLSERFDAICSTAMIMHIPDEFLFEFAYQLKGMLAPGGVLLISASVNRPGLSDLRDHEGRLFVERPASQLQLLFERLGFRLVDSRRHGDAMGRDIDWFTLVLRLSDSAGPGPVDQIETIINRDKKHATYKLALLRALCDIAQTAQRQATWYPDGTVSVPLGLIAEKWLLYYWPIVEADLGNTTVQIPQTRGRPSAFRRPLRELAAYCCSGRGGLDTFFGDFQSASLAPEAARLTDSVLNKISSTIVAGPVRYAGGALDTSTSFFWREGAITGAGRCTTPQGLTAALGSIHMCGEIWRELVLVGHWISQAIVLRWAELTHEISRQGVSVAEAIEKLLVFPGTCREQQRLRSFYRGLPDLECVWTEKPLRRAFEIDHVVPFSLWHNNDLWNLMPATKHANNQKRDKLVSRERLLTSRDRIIDYWRALRKERRERFDYELRRSLTGGRDLGGNWEAPAFLALSEAIEGLALQRGIPRWPAASANVVSMVVPLQEEAEAVTEAPQPVLLCYEDIVGREFSEALPLVADLAAGPASDGFSVGDLTQFGECPWLEVSSTLAGANRFVIRIAGDSMKPTLSVGDLAVFQYHRTPRGDNQIVIMAEFPSGTESGECAVKRITQTEHDWVFSSDNPAYPPRRIPKREATYPILGTFVGKVVS